MPVQSTPFGPSLPEQGWVPAPRYALRRARILELMAGHPPGRLLEVGCGSAALVREFALLGFPATGLEISNEARALAASFIAGVEGARVVGAPSPEWYHSFDYLFSFEVLEHIEDDAGALNTWVEWLRPGGMVVISVPARMALWGATDELAGHFRRYERAGVEALLKEASLERIQIESYGFPLSNMLEPIRNWHHGRQLKRERHSKSLAEATARSGTRRQLEAMLLPFVVVPPGLLIMQAAIALQRRFNSTDLGTGYLAVAHKRP